MLRFGTVCGVLFISVLMLSCSNESIPTIGISTSGCYKSCPIFDLKLDSNTIYFIWIKNSNRKGFYSYSLNKEESSKVSNILSDINIDELQSEYSSNRVDMQVYNTMLFSNGIEKEVLFYEGEAPLKYQKLVDYLIKLGSKATTNAKPFKSRTREKVKIIDVPIPPIPKEQ